MVFGGALLGLAAPVFPGGLPAAAQATTASVWIFPKAALAYAKTDNLSLYNDLVVKNSGETVYQLLNPGTCKKFPKNYPAIKGINPKLFDTEHYYSGYKATPLSPASLTRTVLLDQESWPCTSTHDKSDLVLYDQDLATAVRKYGGLTFATAPGLDLFCNPTSTSCVQCPKDTYGQTCTPCTPSKSDSDAQCYLRYHIAAMEALNANVIDIQAQSLEHSESDYENFVRQAIEQAHAANPSVTVLVGISDGTTDCGSCNAGTLEQELNDAVSYGASGAWINEDSRSIKNGATVMDRVVWCEISGTGCTASPSR